jgi:hypothetical protein
VSRRARSARRLASILTTRAGVYVRVAYDRKVRRYDVKWTGGPDATVLYAAAVENADQVPELDVHMLVWRRADPASSPASRYDYGT